NVSASLWSSGGGAGTEGAGGGRAPDQDRDAVQAQRGGGLRAEGGRGQGGRGREVAHRGGEEQRRTGRPGGAHAQDAADDRRRRQEQDQSAGHGGVAGGPVNLGGDESDQGRDRGDGGAGRGRFRAAAGQGASDRAWPGPQDDADGQREGDDHGQVRDDAGRGEARVPGLQGQDRRGQDHRGEGGSDQHPRRDSGLADGQGSRGDRRDLARGQAGDQDAVAERARGHQVRDRPGQGREHGDPGEDRGEDAGPLRRGPAQRPRVDGDRGGEHKDDQQRVDPLAGRQPGERTLDGEADHRRGEHGGELRVRAEYGTRSAEHERHPPRSRQPLTAGRG